MKFILALALIFHGAGYAGTLTSWVSKNSHYRLDESRARQYVEAAVKYSLHHGVDPFLVLAVMRRESGFRTNAVSSRGAQGPMQVIPKWHPEKVKGKNLKTISQGTQVGVMVLSEYLEMYDGDLYRALKKYSGGSSSYARFVIADRKKLIEYLSPNGSSV